MPPPTQQEDTSKEQEKHQRQQTDAKIGDQVMQTLGQPADLQKVQVRRLWKDHYRVNVLVGVDAASVKVAHSFFLVSDVEGNIIASTPSIRKHK